MILRSRRPEAKAFKRWVTHEVIPAIRKSGSYQAPVDQRPVDPRLARAEDLAKITERLDMIAVNEDVIGGYLYQVGETAKMMDVAIEGMQRLARQNAELLLEIAKEREERTAIAGRVRELEIRAQEAIMGRAYRTLEPNTHGVHALDPESVSVTEARKDLGLTLEQILRLVDAGELQMFRRGPRRRITVASLKLWKEEN